MKVLIDTNVILDVLMNRAAFVDASAQVLRYCEVGKIEGFVCALSIPNIVNIMRKELDPEGIKEIVQRLRSIVGIADLKGRDLINAVSLDFNDYEDAVQSACAERIGAELIVTRNVGDFINSRVPAIRPLELLERL